MGTLVNVTDTGGAANMNAPAAGDTVLATDYNNMLLNVERLLLTPNDVTLGAAPGTTVWGLNQTETESSTSAGSTIVATGTSGVEDLFNEIQALQTFFSQTTETIPTISAGGLITASHWAAAARAIEDCWDGRFGHTPSAVADGATNTYTTTWGVAAASEKLTTTVTHSFASEAACRGFFNGGGFVGVGGLSMTGTGHNADWNTVVSAAGDVILNYTSSTGNTNTGIGFYELTATDTILYSANLGSVNNVYSGDLFTISAKVNSTTNPTSVIFTIVMDDADDNNIDETLDGVFTAKARHRLPNTTGTGYSFPKNTPTVTFAVSAT